MSPNQCLLAPVRGALTYLRHASFEGAQLRCRRCKLHETYGQQEGSPEHLVQQFSISDDAKLSDSGS